MDKGKELTLEISNILSLPLEEKARAIIDSPYCDEILQKIPAQDAYLIIKDSFGGDSQYLLPYLPPERIATFVDIDCWKGDTPSIESLFEWLSELANASDDTLLDAIGVLDQELIILLFCPYLKVIVTSPTDDNLPELIEAGFETFDNNYFFTFTEETEETKLLRFILDRTFLYNQDMYFRILEGVRWELPANMEETAFHHRSIRLTELGFPPPEEASDIYSRKKAGNIIASRFRADQIPVIMEDEAFFLPQIYSEQISGGSLSALMSELDIRDSEIFSFEMMYLANKIIMADYKPLNSNEDMKASLEKAVAITTLGLNIVSRMKEITPAKVLVSMTAETLFSLGYNTLLDLQERLRRCLKDFGRQLAPPSCMETVECLLSKRPVIIEGRFFTVEDFDTADDIVRYLEIMKEILRGFNFKADSLKASNVGAEGLDMENMLLTALALNVVTGKTLLRPLTKSEFERFIDTATDIYDNRRTIKPDFTAGLSDLLENILPELPRKSIEKTVGRLSLRLETEIQGLSEFRQIDPKYITCLIVET